MKRFCLILFAAALAACSAQSSTSFVPSNTPYASSLDDMIAPASTIGTGLSAHAATIKIKSIGVIATINGKYEKGYLPVSPPCPIKEEHGSAVGCVIRAKVQLVVKNLTAFLFTGAKASGCVAGEAKWKGGTVKAGGTFPLNFKWTGKC